VVDAILEPELPRRPLAFALRRLPVKLLYLPAIAFAAVMTIRLSRPSPFGAELSFGALDWIVIVGHDLFFYVAKTLVPSGLGVFYPLPNDGTPGLPLHYYAYALLGAALVAICIASWPRRRWLFFGTAWYLVTIAPNAVLPALVHDPPLVAADRYFYQSAVGLFLLVGLAVSAAARRTAGRRVARATLAGVSVAGVAVLLHVAERHVRDFRDTIPLYEETLRHYPSDAFYYRLALEYAAADRMGAAFQALEQAERAPNRVFFGNLFVDQMRISNLYRLAGDPAKAAAFLARAIDATPNAIEPASTKTPLAYRYLASLYDAAHDPARAAEARAAAESAAFDPSHYFESSWLVIAPDAALPFLEARVREAPGDAIAWYYLGRGLQLNDQPERAAECLRRAQELGLPRKQR